MRNSRAYANHIKQALANIVIKVSACAGIFVLGYVLPANNHVWADSIQHPSALMLGAERMSAYLPMLENKRVGLIVNQSSVIKQNHLLDILRSQGVQVEVLFAPEHGIRGDVGAGEDIESSVDTRTGVAIQSIYGKDKTPPDELMQSIDVVVFDIQDVGTRFYTYISSMHYMMEAAAKHNVHFIVLDRPNPNGMFTDGPILDMAFQSFVGMHKIPILHGLTVGELALMIKGEGWIAQANELSLDVIQMHGYSKDMHYSLPIPPSPNLPNDLAIQLYPSLCFFEATAVSVGRGTDYPFQQVGHNKVKLGSHQFTPESRPYAAPTPKLEGKSLYGIDLREGLYKGKTLEGLNLTILVDAYSRFNEANEAFFTAPEFMDKLAGTDAIRKGIEAGKTANEIRSSWQEDLADYKVMRKSYLLYPQESE